MQYRHMELYLIKSTFLGPNDPQILVTFEWDLTKAEAYLEVKRSETKLPVTLTQLVGVCASRALKDQPELNGRICFGNVRFHVK